MILSPDLRDVWIEPARSHVWASNDFRQYVAAFVREFAREHGWATKGSARVEEKFATSNINVRSAAEPIRDGKTILVFHVTRDRDRRRFECGCEVTPEDLLALDAAILPKLAAVRETLRALEKGTR
jgi:predicted HNH restriction endonuclease